MLFGIFPALLVACDHAAPPLSGDEADAFYTDPILGAVEGESVYFLDDDAEALIQFTPIYGRRVSVPLGATPGRLARAGDRFWVTLPAARGIATLEESGGAITRTGTLETGVGPLGIAAAADGSRLYVALSTTGEVDELDADGEVLRAWAIDGEPSWLALSPDEGSLYVASAFGATLTWIDLVSGAAQGVDVPDGARSVGDEEVTLTPRITGDLAVSPDGMYLAVPMLYVDTTTPISGPNEHPISDPDPESESGYAATSNVSRINPTVAVYRFHDTGEPAAPQARLDLVAASSDVEGVPVRSYVSSVGFSPDSDTLFATMEASDVVIALDPAARAERSLGVSFPMLSTITSPRGPRALAFSTGGLVFFDAFLDRAIGYVDADEVRSAVEASRDLQGLSCAGPASALDPEVLAGRSLFYSAVDTRMAGVGAGVSCSTCHTNGRNDGLSWPLENGPRQTPSLAGGIAASAPFTWTSDVASVADEVDITSQGRMGGEGLTDADAEAVAAFVETIRAPDVPGLGSTDPGVARGEAIFERADVGCGGCHSGSLHTDNQSWALFGLDAVNTPSLRRVSATAPYLHDGRAATLRDLLALCADGSMGDTSMLSAGELDDLELYLRSL